MQASRRMEMDWKGDGSMKSLDEHIAAVVDKAAQKAMDRLIKNLDKEISVIITKHLARLEAQATTKTENLVTAKDASDALGVNLAKVQELMKAGELMVVTTPGGRKKIIQSSINSYIKRLLGAAG